MRHVKKTLLSLVLPAIAAAAHATPVTYTDTFTGSGSLGGVAYTNQIVTLTGTANTTNVTTPLAGIYIVLTSATVKIGAGSAFSFTDVIQAVDNQNFTDAGFGDATNGDGIMFTTAAIFGTYDLKSAVTGSGTSGFNPGDGFGTTGGSFVINSVSGNSTFSAVLSSTVTPEPSSLMLLGTGALGLVGMARRRLLRA